MSLYAQAVSSGMSLLELGITGDNAQTRAAFAAGYEATAKRLAAADMKTAAEKNIAAIKQDKILTDATIQMRQDQAEAFAKVNAAATGVEGQSVDDVIYETEKNEAHAIASANRKAEQQIESQLARINSAQSSLLSVRDTEINVVGELMQAFSSLESKDFKISEALGTLLDDDDAVEGSSETTATAMSSRTLWGK